MAPTPSSPRRLWPLALALPLLAVACGPAGPAAADGTAEPIAIARQAIAGGSLAPTDTAVVAFLDQIEHSLCSGSLIAPNVVLTARHCVSGLLGAVNGGVDCTQTHFDGLILPEAFFVSTAPVVNAGNIGQYRVHDVVGLPGGVVDVCGDDMAILILAGNVAPSVATPFEPRVAAPIAAGDAYTAIGYGATDDGSTGAGTRRKRTGLSVECVGDQCDPKYVTATEWTGQTGVCHGDSGGPALDADGRVAGVVSRGQLGCDAPIYGHVYAWRQWIEDTTVLASGFGQYDPPAWTAGSKESPQHGMAVGQDCTTDADCYSKHCVVQGSASFCSRECDDAAPCPEDYVCRTAAPRLCVEKKPPVAPPTASYGQSPGRAGSGCAVGAARTTGAPLDAASMAAVAALLALARRRRGSGG
jgi:hypothetical protein